MNRPARPTATLLAAEPVSAARDAAVRAAPEGVDPSLVRWMLSLSPAERLEVLQGFADSVWELRGGGRT
jgi:hypothetical protein